MADYTYWNKWVTPIFTSLDDTYNEKQSIKECLTYYKSKDRDEVAGGIKGKLYESDFKFFQTAERKNYRSLMNIKNFIGKQFTTCFLDYFTKGYFPEDVSHHFDGISTDNVEVDIKESWVHISNDKGSWHGNHDHPMTSWGAIYYVQVEETGGENGGQNTFRQPFDNMYSDDGNFFQHDYCLFTLKPTNGMLVLFPANLMHNAKPYYGSGKRIVIAANLCVNFKR